MNSDWPSPADRMPDRASAPTVSVLICSDGRPLLLERCLHSLAKGDDLPDQVVVVSGGDVETAEVLECSARRFPAVVLITHPNRNLSGQRNVGLRHCNGDIIALTDDDAVPAKGWVSAIRSAHARLPDAGAIGGKVVGLNSSSFLSRIADLVVFPDPDPLRPINTLPGVNVSYRRIVMEAVGEFDESLFRGEDVDYNWRVLQLGLTITFDSRMLLQHQHRLTLSGLYHQQYMYGRAYVLVRRKWPDMYCVYPHDLHSVRQWAKLLHCVLAIVYQPLLLVRKSGLKDDRWLAYPTLVGHHLVWKLGMLRQLLIRQSEVPTDSTTASETSVHQWIGGQGRD